MYLKNDGISISYVHKAKNGVEIIFSFYNTLQVALDIIQNDEDPEPQNMEECRKRNYWPKWKKAMHAKLQLLIKQEVSRPIPNV